jgi:hypothetical protein
VLHETAPFTPHPPFIVTVPVDAEVEAVLGALTYAQSPPYKERKINLYESNNISVTMSQKNDQLFPEKLPQ